MSASTVAAADADAGPDRRADAAAGERTRLLLHRPSVSRGAAGDLDAAIAWLQGTRSGATPPMLRIYRPRPTVAFGQRDRRLPGHGAAAEACRRLGFEPLVRRAGGRAAAYHPGCLVVDHIEPDRDPVVESRTRFSRFGELLTETLLRCGVDARSGEIPDEYCPGEHSVHGVAGDRRVKLVGTAQRVIGTGWLFSSVIVVEDGAAIRRVLSEVYEALGLDWDPLTAGAAEDVRPGLDVDAVEEQLLAVYREQHELVAGEPPPLD